jgi:hypothetical protein
MPAKRHWTDTEDRTIETMRAEKASWDAIGRLRKETNHG